MAPPAAPVAAALADEGTDGFLEVRCVGCGETLEVERGLTEFVCPDCATPQSLPPELMPPPPPPRRRALPLPRGAADARGARLPCGVCGELLSVPVGLARCSCPLCGAELAVDSARLRNYILSSAAAAVPLAPAYAQPVLGAREAWQGRPNSAIRSGLARAEPDNGLTPLGRARARADRPYRFSHLQRDEDEYPDDAIDGEEVHEIVRSNSTQQRNRRPVGPGIVNVENRVLPVNAARRPVHDQRSSYTEPGQLARLHRVIHSEELQEGNLSHEVYREARHTEVIYETAATHGNRRVGASVGPRTVGSVENVHIKTPNQIIQKRQKQPSQAIHNERSQVGCSDRVIHAEAVQLEPVSQANYDEDAHIQVMSRTVGRDDNWTAGQSVGHNTVSAEKRKTSNTNEVTQQTQNQQSDTIPAKYTQVEHPDCETHREDVCFQPTKDYTAKCSKRKISHLADPETIVKKRQIEPLSHIMQQAGQISDIDSHEMQVEFEHHNKGIGKHVKQKTRAEVDSNLTMKDKEPMLPANQLTHIYQKDVPLNTKVQNEQTEVKNRKQITSGARKKNRKGLMSSSNVGLQLRRSKRLAKDPVAVVEHDPVESDPVELQVSSPNDDQVSAGAMSSEPIEQEPIQRWSASPNCEVSAATTDTESVESECHEQYAVSPHQSMSDPPDIDRIIDDLCPSASSVHEKLKKVSKKPDDLDLGTSPSNPDMSDPERFAQHYCLIFPREVRRALAKQKSNSLHDLTDSEELLPASPTGTKRNKVQGRGPTRCVKVWTLPKGERVSVSLNNSGLPIGKNATMLINFLGTLVRDGILSPLTCENWKSIPKENKDVMWHIVKLKFDLAPPSESSILKLLRKKWRTWRSHLKRKHYDSHITEEERLANCDPRVLKEQWRFLIAYWGTEKAKAASARCRASRAKSTYRNLTGSKSFAQLFEESQSHEQTRKHSEGSGGDDVSALGAERRGTSRNNEPRTCPSGLQDKAPLKLKASFREAVEAKRMAEDEAAALRKKMTVMEESQKKLQEDLVNMKNTVSAMQRMMPIGGLPDGLMGEPTVPPSFQQDRNARSYHDAFQPYIDEYSALYNPSSSNQQTR